MDKLRWLCRRQIEHRSYFVNVKLFSFHFKWQRIRFPKERDFLFHFWIYKLDSLPLCCLFTFWLPFCLLVAFLPFLKPWMAMQEYLNAAAFQETSNIWILQNGNCVKSIKCQRACWACLTLKSLHEMEKSSSLNIESWWKFSRLVLFYQLPLQLVYLVSQLTNKLMKIE